MFGGQLRVLELSGSAAAMGRAHGESFRTSIRSYLVDRISTLETVSWLGRSVDPEMVVDCAELTIDHHRAYDHELFDELAALSDSAGLSVAETIAVGGYTDVVDVVRAKLGIGPVSHNCTAVLNPALGYLAQTWDMNMSAGEHVIMLRVQPRFGPMAWVQTTAGCLGQIGMNEAGIAIGINNLTSTGRPGVTWPFVVRKVLAQTELGSAVDAVLDAELAGGHNFLVMGPDATAVNIEAMPHRKAVTQSSSHPIAHTNHCLDPSNIEHEVRTDAALVEDSHHRLETAELLEENPEALLSDPRIARRGRDPLDGATCGAVIMEPPRRRMRSVWGVPGDHPWELFEFG